MRKHNVLIGGLAICFDDPVVKFTGGVVSESWKGSQFACEGLNARLDETVVRPASEIQFEASGEVCAAGRPAEGSLEIGFVQSLLASERQARYGFGLATYHRIQPRLPVWDGSGQPWFKKDAVWKIEARDATDLASRGGAWRPFEVETADRPSFGYPDEVPGELPTDLPLAMDEVVCADRYLTCLCVRVGGGTLYCVYQIEWTFGFTTGMVEPLNGGIAVQPGRLVARPYARPPQLVIHPPSANDSVQQKLER